MFICAENANLRLKLHARLLEDALLNLPHQLKHIARRCAADVDDKPRVFFAHLRAADGQAAQTAVVDELCREMPFRTFKRAACAGQIQRLFFPPRAPASPV